MIFHIDPIAKPRMTHRDKWKKRPSVLRYFAYRDAMRVEAGNWKPPAVGILVFNIPMPKSWSGLKKATLLGEPHLQTPDRDNLEKAFFDVFGEDRQIFGGASFKFWSQYGSIETYDWSGWEDWLDAVRSGWAHGVIENARA